mmetsp:Transcript_18461/g.39485  ORF Transcript_18461/g.39485 Transcript_18461/m.39485 type:complete len:517 (-) Transcript_18461:1403-2953(-)
MSQAASKAQKKAVEATLRRLVGMSPTQNLHTSDTCQAEVFHKQVDAVERRNMLLASGQYTPKQVAVFAKEIGKGGIRQYLVDTYAGFIATHAPPYDPYGAFAKSQAMFAPLPNVDNLYEVILENQPCWWYFDLEYSAETNEGLPAAAVADAFKSVLRAFCQEVLSAELDEESVIEMESSTESKFSMHILVKRLIVDEAIVPVALPNNAQAGLLTRELVMFAKQKKSIDLTSDAHLLFVNAPQGEDHPLVSVIDESVYSRNRCFRLLYNSKFGKKVALRMAGGQKQEHPAVRMLGTMASFVPDGVPLFRHALIPEDFAHAALIATRPSISSSTTDRKEGGKQEQGRPIDIGSVPSDLLDHLIDTWDGLRWAQEKVTGGRRPTRVASILRVGEDGHKSLLLVTLQNNRFCLCKGASHRSNSIFLVVDQEAGVFHQKCHDRADCGLHYKSPPFELPQKFCKGKLEDLEKEPHPLPQFDQTDKENMPIGIEKEKQCPSGTDRQVPPCISECERPAKRPCC